MSLSTGARYTRANLWDYADGGGSSDCEPKCRGTLGGPRYEPLPLRDRTSVLGTRLGLGFDVVADEVFLAIVTHEPAGRPLRPRTRGLLALSKIIARRGSFRVSENCAPHEI